jgi:hypothetical protein
MQLADEKVAPGSKLGPPCVYGAGAGAGVGPEFGAQAFRLRVRLGICAGGESLESGWLKKYTDTVTCYGDRGVSITLFKFIKIQVGQLSSLPFSLSLWLWYGTTVQVSLDYSRWLRSMVVTGTVGVLFAHV